MKRKQVLTAILVALGSLLTTLIAILINFATSTRPPVVQRLLPFAWPLVGIMVLAGTIVAIALSRLQIAEKNPASVLQGKYRQLMLEKVHAFWIKGVLEEALRWSGLLALGLQEQPEAVEKLGMLALQQAQQPTRLLPPETPIIQVYNEAGGELLILGEPGAGKTMLLLELARDLLERARGDDTYPLPVVFNLSSWAEKQQPLTEWFIEELHNSYRVPQKISRSWIESDHILPLLDGLDEVAKQARARCVDAINHYRKEHGLLPIVICSRSTEYNDLMKTKKMLRLHSAVVVQPLTAQQIDDYLSRGGQQLKAVRKVLQKDSDLRELVTTPLMLSILTLAYYGKPAADLKMTGTREMRREQIFAVYVQRMLERKRTETHYTFQQTRHWLAWLAGQMVKHDQTDFHVQRPKADWLPGSRLRWAYNVITGILYGLPVGLLIGVSFGLLFGLPVLLFVGLISMLLSKLATREVYSYLEVDGQTMREISNAMLLGLISKLVINALVSGLITGLLAGLVSGLITGLIIGLVGGLLGLIIGLVVYVPPGGLIPEMLRTAVEERNLATFHQRFWLWTGHGLLFGLLFGLIFGTLSEYASGLLGKVIMAPFALAGLWLLLLGLAYIQRLVLHLLLWLSGFLPWNYTRFLDYAAKHILLHKVGHSYIFIHRLLLDYFATLERGPT